MYVAMNRFRIRVGREADFEKLWRERETYLDEVPGFVDFHLLRGPGNDEQTLYISYSTWESQGAFDGWRNSEAFRKAHATARSPEGTLLGHPEIETFDVVL